jgi:anti-sigma regulatory factor (Ser/Thr protein kinase)
MKIRYFANTDTLYIEFRDQGIVDTRDLDENTTPGSRGAPHGASSHRSTMPKMRCPGVRSTTS